MLWVELWLRAVREPDLRPVANRLYGRYRDWIAAVLRAGVEGGEFDPELDVEATADVAMALLDGAGVRAMLDDPGMDVEAAGAARWSRRAGSSPRPASRRRSPARCWE